MPYCARLGCQVLIGVTDDHAFCFGHRDCSLADPCEICENWSLRTSHTLLQAYRDQTRRSNARPSVCPPLTVPYSLGRGRRSPSSSQTPAPPGPSVPASDTLPPCSLPPCSQPPPFATATECRAQQPPATLTQSTPLPYHLRQHPVLLDFPPAPRGRARSLYSYYIPVEDHSPPPCAPLSTDNGPPSFPLPQATIERCLNQDLGGEDRDDSTSPPDVAGPSQPREHIPWTRPLSLPPPRPRRRRAPQEDWNLEIDGVEDPNVLSLSTNEPLDSSDVVRPSARRLSPFPGVSWSELELRAATLITEILPNQAISVPPSSLDFYSSCPPATSSRHSFSLAPAILRELETITTYLNSSRSGATPSISLSRPYPRQALWWIPATSFPAHHPHPGPDTELLVSANPRTITATVEAFTRRADLLRAILLCSSENALLQEAAFIALGNLSQTSGDEQALLIENLRQVMAVASRRTDSTMQMAIRGVAMDVLAHRDAILDASNAPPSRRRQLRAVNMLGDDLFSGALAPLRQALLPTAPAPAPPPAAAAAPPAQAAAQQRFSQGNRPWSPRGGRRPPSNGRGNRGQRNNRSNSASRGASSSSSNPNPHKRSSRK